ncbi:hypothetical protein DTL70_30970 [Streptomyces diacarni]|uniref:DUF916 domain-containing protein n=1 Tax=Streptomyces diacarni TaxID=2800381 RepID=A0A367EAW9_9ACTN|nr:hypothetical protein DTL70_30970 [Streptomyces diacarni]
MLAVSCLLGGGAAVAAPTADDPSWSASPVPPEGAAADEARPFFYLEGPPGTVLKDTLALTNESGEPRTFRLRAADAYNTRDGGFAVRDEGRSEGAGEWLDLAEDTVEVPPRTRAEVPLRVTVPDSAVPGDHPAAVVVSDGERDAGVRLHLRVSGPSLAALSVEDVSVHERADGSAALTYTLVNRGNTALRPRLAFRADGLFGQLTRRAARQLPLELLPGQRVTRHERWPDPPAADLAHVRVTVTAGGGARDQSTASYTAVPWGWGGGVLLVAVAGGAGWYLRGRRRGNGPGRAGATKAQGDGTRHEGADGVPAGAAGTSGDAPVGVRGGGSKDEGSGGQHELTGAAT